MSGNWMQLMAQAWLVYRLSGSAAWLGGITFASQATAFLVSPWAGWAADQFDRRRVLIIVQCAGMAQAILLAVLAGTGNIEPWQVAALSTLQGAFNAFEITTRHAIAQDIVGRELVGSAIALNAVVINGSRVIGPAFGGALIPLIGEVGCFQLNAVSYLAVLVSLAMMRLPKRVTQARGSGAGSNTLALGMLGKMSETLSYVRSRPEIWRLMALTLFISFVALPYTTLLPVIAKDVLGGDEKLLGWLSAMAGLGAVVGSLLFGVGRIGDSDRPLAQTIQRRLLLLVFVNGCCFALLAASRLPWLSCVATFLIGCFLMSMFPQINVSIQTSVDDRLRGRVLSLYNMTFFGAMPVGSLISGASSDWIGVPAVLGVSSALLIGFAWAARCISSSRKVASTAV